MHAALETPQPDWLGQRPDAAASAPTVADLWRWSDRDPALAAERDRVRALRGDADALLNTRREGRGNTSYRARRETEQLVADALDRDYLIPQVAAKLRNCRLSGQWGFSANRPDKPVVVWDHKCGLSRLCPDEIRIEGRRLTASYKPAILDWKRAGFRRRVQYAVFTQPNAPEGSLAEFKRFQMKAFSQWREHFPEVKGALVVQEDPLSQLGGWHVHLNVLLLIDGWSEWADWRVAWTRLMKPFFPGCRVPSYNVHEVKLPHTEVGLDRALRELIKYPIKFVTAKGEGKARDASGEEPAAPLECESDHGTADLDSDDPGKCAHRRAPAFTDWSREQKLEWWEAGQGFRRSRSYGSLFNLHALYWNRLLTKAARAKLLVSFSADPALAGKLWLKLPKGVREALKPLLIPDDTEDRGALVMSGRVAWSVEHRCYLVFRPSVEFIPEDKSANKTGPPRDNYAAGTDLRPHSRWHDDQTTATVINI